MSKNSQKIAKSLASNKNRLIKVLVLSVIFCLSLLIFVELAEDIIAKEPIGFDLPIQEIIFSWRSPWLTTVTRFITNLGSALFVISFVAISSLILLWRRYWLRAGFLIASVGIAGVMNLILKGIFQRQRPDVLMALVEESSHSFPSGHAMSSMALAATIALLCWNTKWRWPALIGASIYTFLVGLSRIYLGVHYASDVVAGWSAGLIWVIIFYKVAVKTEEKLL